MSPKKVIKEVWNNNPPKRYLPIAYSSKGLGWGIWDAKEKRFIEKDKDLRGIDPKELLTN